MATVALLVGGALVNALAFSGSNYLFSHLDSKGTDEERKRHDLAVEQTQEAQAAWSRRNTERYNWENEQYRRQSLADKNFRDADEALDEYARATRKTLAPGPYPQLSDYYTPSDAQKDREIAFVVLGMTAVGFVAYKLHRRESGK